MASPWHWPSGQNSGQFGRWAGDADSPLQCSGSLLGGSGRGRGVRVERALRVGPASLTPEEQALVTRDAELMQRLHREAWQRWPVESWSQGRERPQLPPEPSLHGSELG